MSELLSLHCSNCGTPLDPPAAGTSAVVCPICQFINEASSAPAMRMLTPDTLELELEALIDQARTSGIELDEIVRVLRDELEFTAELASSGRNLSVQIIDLGPMEAHDRQHLIKDRSALLRGRVVGR
jgi:LSD1 subclass zinc finger protein